MAEPKKRIIVDGVDFSTVFLFPKIFRAVPAALQPPRLIIGLLMVVALVTVGRIWDGVTTPDIHHSGLIASQGLSATEEREAATRAQGLLREMLSEYGVPESKWPAGAAEEQAQLDPRTIIKLVQTSYRSRRTDLAEGEVLEAVRERDVKYRRDMALLESVRPKGPFEATSKEVSRAVVRILAGALFLSPDLDGDRTDEIMRSLAPNGLEPGLEEFVRQALPAAQPVPQGLPAVWIGVKDLFVNLPVALWQQEKVFTVVYGLFFLVVVAIGGGTISRMTACEVATSERLTIGEATDFAIGNWVKLVTALLLPLIFAGILVVLLIVGGLLMAPWLDVIGGLLYGLALLLGFALVLLLTGYAAGFHLLVPSVACENCDPADALQRVYAYVLSRPLRLLLYVVVALLGLVLGFLVVSFFAGTMLNFTAALCRVFTDNSALTAAGGFGLFDLDQQNLGAIHETWHNQWAAWLVTLWQTLVIDLVAAFVIGYYFAASTIVHLLMRQACDGQDMEDIWRPGLTPGTLAPMPGPVVHREKGPAETAISGAMRTATAVRYGKSGDESKAGEGTAEGDEKAGE